MSLTRRTSRSVLPMAMSIIWRILSGRAVSAPPGDEAQRGAQRRERRAQLVRDGGDELVLHAVERVALGDVGEGDDDMPTLRPLGSVLLAGSPAEMAVPLAASR